MELRSSGAIKQGVAAELGIAVIPLGAIELDRGEAPGGAGRGRLPGASPLVSGASGGAPSAAAAALWRFLLAHRGEVVSELPQRMARRG